MDGMIKRVELRASQSAVETEILKVLYDYEELVLKVKNKGRRVRAIYTWRMFDNHGIIKAIERLMRTRKKQAGFNGLTEIGLQDLTFDTNLRARLNYSNMQPTTQEGVADAKENESIRRGASIGYGSCGES